MRVLVAALLLLSSLVCLLAHHWAAGGLALLGIAILIPSFVDLYHALRYDLKGGE